MTTPEQRLLQRGLVLPAPVKLPLTVRLPFTMINVRGNHVGISGHPRHGADGSLTGPYGKVGTDVSMAEAQDAARDIGLCMLANLKAEIGELSRVAGWLRVFGMVNSSPDFSEQHLVINGFSDLIIDLFGPDIGRHSRSAVGVAGLPMNFAIEIEAELLLS